MVNDCAYCHAADARNGALCAVHEVEQDCRAAYDEYRAKMRKAGLRGWLTYESWLESELRVPAFDDVPPGPSVPFSAVDDEDTVEP